MHSLIVYAEKVNNIRYLQDTTDLVTIIFRIENKYWRFDMRVCILGENAMPLLCTIIFYLYHRERKK